MAFDITATLTQSLRSKYAGKLDKNEYRRSNYGALRLFQEQSADPTGILDEDLKTKLVNSFGNTVGVPVIDYNDVTLSNARTCAMQSSDLNSNIINVTFVTVAFGIALAPAMFKNNDIAFEQAFNKLLEARLIKTAATLDQAAVNFLNTNKNQYFPADLLAYYAQVAGALQVSQADKNDLYNMLGSIMSTMDFGGQSPEILTNPIGMADVRRLMAQGGGNSVNESFQFAGYEWFESNRVTNAVGVNSTIYSVAPGSVATVTRLDPDVLMGNVIGDSSNPLKQWTVASNLPIINSDMGVFYQADCADKSAAMAAGVSGLTRTKVESWEFSMDYAFISSYNSDPVNTYSPILKLEVTNA